MRVLSQIELFYRLVEQEALLENIEFIRCLLVRGKNIIKLCSAFSDGDVSISVVYSLHATLYRSQLPFIAQVEDIHVYNWTRSSCEKGVA